MPRKKFVAGNWKMNTTLAEAKALAAAVGEGRRRRHRVHGRRLPAVPLAHRRRRGAEGLAGRARGAGLSTTRRRGRSPARSARRCSSTSAASTSSSATASGGTGWARRDAAHQPEGHSRPRGRAARHPVRRRDARRARSGTCTERVFQRQVYAGLRGAHRPSSSAELVIAYEPVWAIGTGKVATPEQAQEAHAFIRRECRRTLRRESRRVRFPSCTAGRVKPDNAAGLMSQPDVDGGLVGGASLKADSFLAIVKAAAADRALPGSRLDSVHYSIRSTGRH